MEIRYVPSLVVLSVSVAIFASYVALNLAHSVTQAKGKAQFLWLVYGALAMGVGIWSMHFVGMLAFEMPGMEMAYDVPLMILSVLVAVLASALALYVVSRPVVLIPSLVSAGIAMAGAIAGMHYIGMYSMRMSARIEWNVYLVILSIAIALVASFGALLISIRLRNEPDRFTLLVLASIIMGFAISGMHYTGMFAATFIHDESLLIKDTNLLVTSGLSIAVIAMTLLILGIALTGSVGQRIMALRASRAEDVLVTSEERFRLLVEAVKDYAIFMLDPDGRITTWNSGAERITGYADEEVIGRHFLLLYGNETPSQRTAAELDVAREEGHFEGEAIHVRKDGSKFWANAVISPLYNRDGSLNGYSKVMRDITQIREAESKMRNLNEELERRVRERTVELEQREAELKAAKEAAEVANATKSAFLANMSHEIRTPLGAILGFSELMLSDMSQAEKITNIGIIKRNGKLLSSLINDILDLSKVEAGKLEIEKSNVRLVDLVNETASLLNLEANEKGVKITVSSEGVIPNTVHTDSMRLRQILFNIIGNAVKFTQKGSVDVKVKLVPRDGTTKLAFIVKDSGTGISPEQSARLFSPFTQADVTTTRKFGGTGLGLVLSKKLATALGGDVFLESSALGEGSTFVILIDHGQSNEVLFESARSADRGVTPVQMRVAPNPNGRALTDLHVLLVDDSSDNQALIKKLLVMAGATVDTAGNGRDGVEKALLGDYGVVLMDLQMPVMDGYEATKELRRQNFRRPIVALTAHAMKEERRKCLESGFNDHLTKPIDRELLVATLSEYVPRVARSAPGVPRTSE